MLLIAAALRLWRLEDNGFGTAYYAAGVRSMMQSAWLFFYNAFDPAGFISLDKPPVAFWIQTAFAIVLGYSGWAIHLPQALADRRQQFRAGAADLFRRSVRVAQFVEQLFHPRVIGHGPTSLSYKVTR